MRSQGFMKPDPAYEALMPGPVVMQARVDLFALEPKRSRVQVEVPSGSPLRAGTPTLAPGTASLSDTIRQLSQAFSENIATAVEILMVETGQLQAVEHPVDAAAPMLVVVMYARGFTANDIEANLANPNPLVLRRMMREGASLAFVGWSVTQAAEREFADRFPSFFGTNLDRLPAVPAR